MTDTSIEKQKIDTEVTEAEAKAEADKTEALSVRDGKGRRKRAKFASAELVKNRIESMAKLKRDRAGSLTVRGCIPEENSLEPHEIEFTLSKECVEYREQFSRVVLNSYAFYMQARSGIIPSSYVSSVDTMLPRFYFVIVDNGSRMELRTLSGDVLHVAELRCFAKNPVGMKSVVEFYDAFVSAYMCDRDTDGLMQYAYAFFKRSFRPLRDAAVTKSEACHIRQCADALSESHNVQRLLTRKADRMELREEPMLPF